MAQISVDTFRYEGVILIVDVVNMLSRIDHIQISLVSIRTVIFCLRSRINHPLIGKHLAFKIPSGKRFVRCDSLGADYSEAAIMERISGKRIVVPRAKATVKSKPNLLIDIQAKMQQANSPGFERWAKSFNLKEMARTVMY